ncbi:hypothetical protein FQR65_LT04712 [Abscondita terminalis]|nr:hypothetical protein FQR65_LT04712 [Abscondita terminalis]
MNKRYSLDYDTFNPNLKVMEYAVCGQTVARAAEIRKELEKGIKKPFAEVISANYGDCHDMKQTPITYNRQLLSTLLNPQLLDDPLIPSDIKAKAKELLMACQGSVGCYTDSAGIELIRKHVAQYIETRDGYTSKCSDIVLSNGASEAIKSILKLFICSVNGKPPGVMIPIPQYPLYSAILIEFGIEQIEYYLNEETNWQLEIEELERAFDEYSKQCTPRAIVVINPGNPTGQVLSKENIQDVIKFAHRRNLFILADEVYQHNIYAEGSKFYSFKKILMEMGEPYSSMELASFMSCSKGYMGECGLRGGYVEVINMNPEVKRHYLESISAMVCPTVVGQVSIDAVVNPPVKGDASYNLYIKEKTAILDSLKLRARMVDAFNSFEGFSCNVVQGAMYAFPRISLPPKAIEAAAARKQHPDEFYAFELLERTGICIVPGSGFGQKPGTFHFRTTILPQPKILAAIYHKMYIELLLLASLLYLSYIYLTKNFNYWKQRNVPYIEPTLFFGNLFKTITVQQGIGESISLMYGKVNTPYIGVYVLQNPLLIIRDPKLIRNVLVKNFNSFCDRYVVVNKKSDWMSANMLFLAKNPEWKYIRAKMSPVFSPTKLKKMLYLITEMGTDMTSYLMLTADNNNSIDIREICEKFATNVITSCAFGLNARSFQNHDAPFRKYSKMMFDSNLKCSFRQTCYFVSHALVKLFNFPFFDREVSIFMRNMFWESVTQRNRSKEIRHDLIDIIKEFKTDFDTNNTFKFEGDTMVAQASNFFAAGFETVCSTLTFALYELSLNLDIQQRLRTEINEKRMHYKEMNYDCLESMTYLTMVVNETLRKYPVVPTINRVCNKDYKLPNSNLILSRGTPVFISILGLHNDPQYYPNPQAFNPERFSLDNKNTIIPFTYLPFGAGPRNCIGIKFGLLTIKVGLAEIISNFYVTPCVNTPKTIEYSARTIFLKSKFDIPLRMRKITEQ